MKEMRKGIVIPQGMIKSCYQHVAVNQLRYDPLFHFYNIIESERCTRLNKSITKEKISISKQCLQVLLLVKQGFFSDDIMPLGCFICYFMGLSFFRDLPLSLLTETSVCIKVYYLSDAGIRSSGTFAVRAPWQADTDTSLGDQEPYLPQFYSVSQRHHLSLLQILLPTHAK